MPKRSTPSWLPYLLAALAIVVASVVGHLLTPALTSNVLYVTYFAAIAIAAWYGGFGPALFATALSYLVANLYFITPQRAFALDVSAFAYVFVCLLIAGFSEAMRRALRRAEASAAQVVSIVDSISDGFVALDGEGRCVYMNPAAEQLQLAHRQDFDAATRSEFFPLALGGPDDIRLREAARAGEAVEFESFYEPWQRWFEFKASPADSGRLAVHFRDITQCKKAEENLRFFSDTGNVLSALVDLESTMQKIARLAVPFFADWCVVDIVDQHGEAEQIASAHRDVAKEPILRKLVDRSARPWKSSLLSLRALTSGSPELVSDVPANFVDTLAYDDEHRQLLAAVGPRSFIIVPLIVRERVIGSLSFVNSESGRRYSAADSEIATELARRAAVAIDNARLYRELKVAERQKDQFLAMLRTSCVIHWPRFSMRTNCSKWRTKRRAPRPKSSTANWEASRT